MKKNNYDNKSNDHSIECLTFYDTDISQMYFKDNITILQHSGYSKSCVAFFHESGKNHDDIDFTVKGSKSEMVRFLWQEANRWYRNKTELNQKTKSELIEDIFECFRYDINAIDILTLDELNDYFKPVLTSSQRREYERVNQEPNNFNLEIVPEGITIKSIETRGYSQGDYAKVYYSPEFIKAIWGSLPDEDYLRDYIHNLFWDALIYARAEIDGKEYDYNDRPNSDPYEWDRDAWVEYLSSETGIDKSEFEPLIPEYPDYD